MTEEFLNHDDVQETNQFFVMPGPNFIIL